MWSFQTEGFQYRTGFSRGLLHLLSNISKFQPDEQKQAVDTKPLSEFHMHSFYRRLVHEFHLNEHHSDCGVETDDQEVEYLRHAHSLEKAYIPGRDIG